MFQQNSRIEQTEYGIRFYEQDVIYDDYVYNDIINMTLDIDYFSSGFGILIAPNAGSSIDRNTELYLFRIGYREASVIYKNGTVNRTLVMVPLTIKPPIESMKIRFIKIGQKITLTIDGIDVPLISYTVPKIINKYNIGIYSNAGNLIKNISINSRTPNYWNINMHNTIGGRIRFVSSGFDLSECQEVAEIEQTGIELEAGTYYLQYKVSNGSDIKCYVFHSRNSELRDENKNLLNDDNSFVLGESGIINLKFVGKSGNVSNIIINKLPDSKYVATNDEDSVVPRSKLIINTSELLFIRFTASILSYDDSSSLFITDTAYAVDHFNVEKNEEYTYLYDVKNHSINIINDGEEIFNGILSKTEVITIFDNVDAIMSELIITKDDYTEINYSYKDTEKRIIPSSYSYPIIITDMKDNPLDISSSYRIKTYFDADGNIIENDDEYVFTNIEREYFEPNSILRLDKQASSKFNTFTVYGIYADSSINFDYIYRINNDLINDISIFADIYENINERDFEYDSLTNEIYLNCSLDRYKYIIVDYLKEDSYAINENFDSGYYVVDISTANSDVKYYYNDSTLNIIKDSKIVSLNDLYGDCYLVLNKEVTE